MRKSNPTLLCPTSMIDGQDERIIIELQHDARRSDAEIARKLGVSETSIRRRVRRLVGDGIIRIMASVNPEKVGYASFAHVGIKANLTRIDRIAERFASLPMVHFAGITAGQFDIVLWVAFPTHGDLTEFIKNELAAVPGVIRSETLINLQIKKWDQRILPNLHPNDTLTNKTRLPPPGQQQPVRPQARKLDDRDYKIVLELQKDGRQRDAEISRKLGFSEATVRRRIGRLTRDGIMNVVAVISPTKVGYITPAHIGIQADLMKLDEMLERLAAMPRVHFVVLAAGRFDVIIWTTFHTPQELADFVKNDLVTVPGIISSETLINLDIKKRETSILLPLS